MRPILPARLAAVLAVMAVTAACSQPTPTPLPATPTPAAGPTLAVERAVVTYRERETDALAPLPAGSSQEVPPGANVVVETGGRATLLWPMFLTNALLSGADTLLSLSEPNNRRAILDQAAGTARYTVAGAGEPTDLQVNAGFLGVGKSVAVITVDAGPADFIVHVEPDANNKPIAWVAVLEGEVNVVRDDDDRGLEAGEAAAFSADGDMSEPLPVEVAALTAWYDAIAAGTAAGPIALVAFRCEVDAEAGTAVRANPGGSGPVLVTLPKSTLVNAVAKSVDDTWLRITSTQPVADGWAARSDLVCSGPILLLPNLIPGATATPTSLATRPPARLTPVATATLAGTFTPTPTGTATFPAYVFEFGVSPSTIDPGDCATLAWNVEGVRQVFLDGSGVSGGQQTRRVCPDETTTYTMTVVKTDGTEESKSATVTVRSAAPTNTSEAPPEPTYTEPPPLPTDTPDLPDPTDTPEPEPEPTDTPAAG